MNINITNYESWFLDYHEGNLTAEQVAELFLFLEQHPELKQELDAFEEIGQPLEAITANFPDKEPLKKEDLLSEKNIHEWLVAEIEGNLSEERIGILEAFLKLHPSYYNDRELFLKTKLQVDATEIFTGKAAMKKSGVLTENSIQEWLIAEVEGNLNLQERQMLFQFLEANPVYKRDRELYRLTILAANTNIAYPDKPSLYKGAGGTGARIISLPKPSVTANVQSWSRMRIAAILLILIGAAILFTVVRNEHPTELPVAEIKERTVNPASSKNEFAEKVKSPETPEMKEANTNNQQPEFNQPKQHSLPDQNNSIRLAQHHQKKQQSTDTVLEHPSLTIKNSQEEFTAMQMKRTPILKTEELFVFTERRYTPKATPAYENPNEPPSLTNILQPERITGEIKTMAAHTVNKAAGEELLGTPEMPAKLPLGSRILKFAAKAVGKLSRDKVKVRTAFNPVTGKLSAYEVETEKKVYQKQF